MNAIRKVRCDDQIGNMQHAEAELTADKIGERIEEQAKIYDQGGRMQVASAISMGRDFNLVQKEELVPHGEFEAYCRRHSGKEDRTWQEWAYIAAAMDEMLPAKARRVALSDSIRAALREARAFRNPDRKGFRTKKLSRKVKPKPEQQSAAISPIEPYTHNMDADDDPPPSVRASLSHDEYPESIELDSKTKTKVRSGMQKMFRISMGFQGKFAGKELKQFDEQYGKLRSQIIGEPVLEKKKAQPRAGKSITQIGMREGPFDGEQLENLHQVILTLERIEEEFQKKKKGTSDQMMTMQLAEITLERIRNRWLADCEKVDAESAEKKAPSRLQSESAR